MQRKVAHIGAGEFKEKCLKLMDEVYSTHVPLIITKRGIPIAKLIPIEEEPVHLFGLQKDSVVIKSDIISPIGDHWDANS